MNCIIGTNFSGISLLAGIANCSKEVSLENDICLHPITYDELQTRGLKMLNHLYSLLSVYSKFIWIVRHPLVTAIKHHKKEQISLEQSFKYWVDVNTILWYFINSLLPEKCIKVKFEDILLEQKKSVKKFFDFIEVPFSPKYLHYGDFPQPSFEGNTFKKGVIDIEQVDPECCDMTQIQEVCKDMHLDVLATLGYEID